MVEYLKLHPPAWTCCLWLLIFKNLVKKQGHNQPPQSDRGEGLFVIFLKKKTQQQQTADVLQCRLIGSSVSSPAHGGYLTRRSGLRLATGVGWTTGPDPHVKKYNSQVDKVINACITLSKSGEERQHLLQEKPSVSFFALLLMKKYSPVLTALML